MRNVSALGPALAGVAIAFSACPAPPAPTPPEPPPVITTFAADQAQVTAGTAVKLSFTTERATEVELLDPRGDRIAFTGDAAAGEATVMPNETSFYVLRASGAGGRDSAFVQVAVNEGLRRVFLVAVPAEIDSGEEVTVAWSALGGSGVTLRDSSGQTLSTEESGSRTLTLTRSATFDLRATGLLGLLTASASVKVRPVIQRFAAVPPAARQGQKLELHWQTRGAESVRLTEATLGELVTITSQTAVDDGTFEFTVPSDFNADGGVPRPVPDNYPLQFTLTAATASPPQTVTADLRAYVRDGPGIVLFDVPGFSTEAKPATVRWTTVNAHRAELLLGGALVYSTAPPATANGSFTLPSLGADVDVTLVVYDFNGLSVRQTRRMRVAKAPKVNTFTLPGAVSMGGTPATAMWTTTNATSIVIRIKDGPIVHETQVAAMISAGMTSVLPSRTTTYVLEAYNDAGDKDSLERTVTVSTPIVATATPSPTTPGSLVTLTWDVSGLAPSDIIGIPDETPQSMSGSTGFSDIHGNASARVLTFSQSNDATATFTVPFGFTVPIAGVPLSTFTASTNGFLALGPTSPPLGTNADLKAAMGTPPPVPLLAPFWDDLDLLNDGTVEWLVDGAAFPRRLIVQWTNAHVAGDPATALTFQVQLYETGELRFEYSTLTGTAADGSGATVGIFLGAQVLRAQFSYEMGVVSTGLQLVWFTNGPQVGVRPVVVGTESLSTGFYYKTTNNQYGWVSVAIRVFGTNSVVVNEVMPVPALGVTEGQFIELYNATGQAQDFGGLEISTGSAPLMTFTIPPETFVANNGYLVLGQSQNMNDNGGAPVDVAYGMALSVGIPDSVSVKVLGSLMPDGGPTSGPFVVNTFEWDGGSLGISSQRDYGIGSFGTCTRSAMYGTAGSVGTPGAENESCFPYRLTSIPVAFEDISTTATPLFSTSGWDEELEPVTLPFPFHYFGADAGTTTIAVSSNAWLSARVPVETDNEYINRVTLGGSPQGMICPLWDDLADNSMLMGTVSNAFAAASGNHFVVQWNKVAFYSDPTGEMTMQVKLFPDGVIEFHYREMIDGTDPLEAGRATGTEATVWIESPDGTAALPIALEQGVIQPNTAYRFTPTR